MSANFVCLLHRTQEVKSKINSVCFRTLARFHAVSFAMFGGDYKAIQEQYPFLQETRYLKPEDMDEDSKRKMSRTFKMEAEELRQRGFEAEANLIDAVYDDRFRQRMHKFTGEWVPNAVVKFLYTF